MLWGGAFLVSEWADEAVELQPSDFAVVLWYNELTKVSPCWG